MRVIVTCASGFAGSAIVAELIGAGHEVLGLARWDAATASLASAGAKVHRGPRGPGQPAEWRSVPGRSDSHRLHPRPLGIPGDSRGNRRATETLGDALAGSDRPFVIASASGMGSVGPGQPATEDHFDPSHPNPRAASDVAAAAVMARGVRVSVVRLPQVHDRFVQVLVTYGIAVAREKGISACIGEGLNRWPAVFAGMDLPASSALTQRRLGCRPTQKPGLIEDLDSMNDFGD